ncbi:MAG: hypothetical protein ACTHMC_17630 [Pseudobacter sp.]|uniref:hypothetical protein n=1 Tax=Pseudobacter sp. TaxID=2045420 RepID=UPI003F7F2D8A
MWNPKEVRKLIAQVSGILFGIGGFYLMTVDAKATGKINITSNLLSGQIESGSAGLLLIFFAFFLIMLPTFLGGHHVRKEPSLTGNPEKKKNLTEYSKTVIAFLVTALLCAGSFFYSDHLANKGHQNFSGVLSFVGYLLVALTGVFFFGVLFYFFGGSESESNINEESPSETGK